MVHGCPVVVGGDLNVHVEDPSDASAARLSDLFHAMDMKQHVTQPTHQAGGTLDLIVTFSDFNVDDLNVDPPGAVSDHSLITCNLPYRRTTPPTPRRRVRSWRTVDRDALRQAIMDSPLGCGEIPASATADELFAMYDRTLRDIAVQFAPERTVQSKLRPLSPWFDSECRAIRRNCRRLERLYRRTRSAADGQALTAAQRHRSTVFKDKRDRYWSDRIADQTGSPVKLWNTMNAILQRDKRTADDVAPTPHDADTFLRYFDEKVKSVRAATASHPLPVFNSTAEVLLSTLRPCSEDEVRRLIAASPTKSCALDPIPTFLLNEMVDVLLPYVTEMINASLREG